ncbi:hypothetical protein JI75_08775 [Berryella intestinalis]|uniref:Uncharacterized protein n=1 Tax=Berryella intestinalis TaxID=1531429 RepID=A0A0A8BC32_9ACTN|nr:hypothetical protein JI75_08775 [Berryella intestinalis]
MWAELFPQGLQLLDDAAAERAFQKVGHGWNEPIVRHAAKHGRHARCYESQCYEVVLGELEPPSFGISCFKVCIG